MSFPPPHINSIFDINEKTEEESEVDVEILNDDDINHILNATDGIGHNWEQVEDDNNIETQETERIKVSAISKMT